MSIVVDIYQEAIRNTYFRHVVHTGKLSQLVVMAIPAYDQIGEEVHRSVEQSLFIVDGSGAVFFNGRSQRVRAGDAIVITPGTRHNVVAGSEPLRLFTIYTPPNHIDGRVHRTRADAEADVENQAFGQRVERVGLIHRRR